eukprot:gene13240-biopygen6534
MAWRHIAMSPALRNRGYPIRLQTPRTPCELRGCNARAVFIAARGRSKPRPRLGDLIGLEGAGTCACKHVHSSQPPEAVQLG